MNTLETIQALVTASIRTKERLLSDAAAIRRIKEVSEVIVAAYRRGNKTLWAGNGGSAADAQHMVGELVNKFCMDRPGLPSMALTVDPSVVTSIGNDFSFNRVFARQIEACAVSGDVFIGISTSGNSRNLVEALAACREKGVVSVALVGASPCAMDEYDYVLHVPAQETPRIQECHTLVGHILCYLVEQELFGQ